MATGIAGFIQVNAIVAKVYQGFRHRFASPLASVGPGTSEFCDGLAGLSEEALDGQLFCQAHRFRWDLR